jgi:uncharacterized membrane protein
VKTGWRFEASQIVLIVAMFAAAAVAWPSAPDQIPVHWNISGEVDRYGGRFEGLFLLPLIAAGLYLLMRYMPILDPGRANYARFGGAYAALRIAILVVMAGVQTMVLVTVFKAPVNVSLVVPLMVGALFVLMGALMGKIRPNWFVGIRTPWTLSSKTSWVRTHRLGGWLFVAQGLLFILSGVLGLPMFSYIVMGSMLAVVVALYAYSYVVYRADPDKQSPAGTQPSDDE